MLMYDLSFTYDEVKTIRNAVNACGFTLQDFNAKFVSVNNLYRLQAFSVTAVYALISCIKEQNEKMQMCGASEPVIIDLQNKLIDLGMREKYAKDSRPRSWRHFLCDLQQHNLN